MRPILEYWVAGRVELGGRFSGWKRGLGRLAEKFTTVDDYIGSFRAVPGTE
ncbi:MAG: hypothetical protein ABWX92_08960 [Mycetocola sp.]